MCLRVAALCKRNKWQIAGKFAASESTCPSQQADQMISKVAYLLIIFDLSILAGLACVGLAPALWRLRLGKIESKRSLCRIDMFRQRRPR